MRTAGFFLLSALAMQGATTHCITVAGLGGEPDYEQRFTAQAKELEKLLGAEGSEARVQTLLGAGATKAALQNAVRTLSSEAKPDDIFVLTLIGHGTFDGEDYKFNVPGSDVSATELASMLDRVSTGRQLVVVGTSASGAAIHALHRPNRTVITATKSGTEKNAPVFARYWVEALRDAASDTDKNETITALEAFRFAELKTKQFYETNKRIATEHPMLDSGDAAAVSAAGRVTLLRTGSAQAASQDPAKRALLVRRDELETQIDNLKLQKAAMPIDEYKKQLQALLLDLARTQAELDK